MLQRLFQKNRTIDPIRESAALTTVYLLELNRKFEAFVREKIDQLEPVVSSLEARTGQTDADDDWGRSQPGTTPPVDEEARTDIEPTLKPLASTPDEADPPVSVSQEPARAHRLLNEEAGFGAVVPMGKMLSPTQSGGKSPLSPVMPSSVKNDDSGGEIDEEDDEDIGPDSWQRELGLN